MGSLKRGYGSAAQSPDDYRRQRSGFWTHEYRVDSGETVWRCDLHKMHEAVRDVMMDQREHQLFSQDPHKYLDMMYGEGTAKVYFTKHESNRPYVDYRFPRHFGADFARDDMRDSMAYLYNTGTTTNTTTATSGTTANYMMMMQDEMKRKMQNELLVPARNFPKIKKDDTFKFRPSLVRNMPFVHGGDSLLKTLQRDFDHWAGPQLKVIHAAI